MEPPSTGDRPLHIPTETQRTCEGGSAGLDSLGARPSGGGQGAAGNGAAGNGAAGKGSAGQTAGGYQAFTSAVVAAQGVRDAAVAGADLAGQTRAAARRPEARRAARGRFAEFREHANHTAFDAIGVEDAGASRWFAIQLSTAEQAFDPDSVPNLDIFTVYRLYSVAGLDQGRIIHALRLGFFSDEIAANTVASYLTAFYQSSAVKRVSAAERERFAEQCFEARKDVGATGQHAASKSPANGSFAKTASRALHPPVKSVDPSGAPPWPHKKAAGSDS